MSWTGHLEDAAVSGVLAEGRIVRAVHAAGEVASTQDVALALARAGMPGGTVIVAERQSAGRGRGGQRWDDVADGGTLAVTLLLDIPMDVTSRAAPLVPHALGLAVAMTAMTVAPGRGVIGLKWPNDVMVRDGPNASPRKLAGVLIERERTAGRDVLLAGIGLNVDLRAGAARPDRACLAERVGASPSRPGLLAALFAAIDDQLVTLRRSSDELLHRYRTLSETIDRTVEVTRPGAERIVGTAVAVDAEGRLVVRTDDALEVFLSGTVRDHVGDEPGANPVSRPA